MLTVERAHDAQQVHVPMRLIRADATDVFLLVVLSTRRKYKLAEGGSYLEKAHIVDLAFLERPRRPVLDYAGPTE